MTFTIGNRAIRDHISEGKKLHLFKKNKSNRYVYLGEFKYVSYQFVDGQDLNARPRKILVFTLATIRSNQSTHP